MRKEIKYVIGIEDYMRLKPKLKMLMRADSHGDGGRYTVRSQYYDSLTDADWQDNLNGVMEKRKIRVRTYSPFTGVARLEYKCKSGSWGIKNSLALTQEEAMLMEKGRYDCLRERDEELARYLYVKMTQQVYRPKTIIEYERSALTYQVGDVRVTFDCHIRASINPLGICEKDVQCMPVMAQDKGILEVKYNDFLPQCLKNIISTLDAVPEAYSKYTASRLMYI